MGNSIQEVSPTPEQPIEIECVTGNVPIHICGKNVLPNQVIKTVITKNGITAIPNNDGSITFNGTATNTAYFDLVLRVNPFAVPSIGTYTVSLKNTLPTKTFFTIGYENNTIAKQITAGTKTATFDIKSVKLFSYVGFFSGASVSNYTIYPQLEVGEKETEYEQHHEEILTLPLGETKLNCLHDINGNAVAQDKPIWKDNKWQWEVNIGKIMLKGVENWQTYENSIYTTWYSDNYMIPLNNDSYAKCNNFKCVSFANRYEKDSIFFHPNGNLTYILNTDSNASNNKFATREEFVNYLSTNNTSLLLPRKTPTYQDCTVEQATILDKLSKYTLQKGINHIFSTENVVPWFKVSYTKSNEIAIDEIKQAIIALGGVL